MTEPMGPEQRLDPLADGGAADLAGGYAEHRRRLAADSATQRLLDRVEGITGADPALDAARGVKAKAAVRTDPARLAAEREANARVAESQAADAAEARAGAAVHVARSVAEMPKQAAGGVLDALTELGETSIQINRAVADAMPEPLRRVWFGGTVYDLSDEDRRALEAELGKSLDQAIEETIAQLPGIEGPKTGTGAVTRSVTTFLTGFLSALKGVRTLKGGEAVSAGGRMLEGALAGALADAAVMDEQAGRLADLWGELGLPENVLTGYLESDPGDSVAEAKFKTALEGALVGAPLDLVFESGRAIRSALTARREAPFAAEGGLAAARAEYGEVTQRDFLILGDPDAPLFSIEAKAPADGAAKIREAERPGGGIDEAVGLLTETDIRTIGDPTSAIGGVAVKINWARIDAPEDVTAVMGQMADAFRDNIGKARRGTISQEQTEAMAAELGLTVRDLLARRKGQAFNAEEILAARNMWVSSAEKLLETARRAAAPNAGKIDQFNFRRMMAIHYAVQAEVLGARAEAGRALNAWKIPSGGGVEQARSIELLMREMGGPDASAAMAKRLAILAEQGGDLAAINAVARKGWGAASADAIREVWVNGLLSSPKTHLVNISSNSVVALQQIYERRVAETISGLAGRAGDGVAPGEAAAMLHGLVEANKDMFRLAWKGIRARDFSELGALTAEAGAASKLDLPHGAAVSAEAFGLQDNAVARSIDLIGSAFRVPGALLMAEDGFFKTIGYRMELHAQAVRQATAEGLAGEQLAARAAELAARPTEAMRIAAADAALYNTFTNRAGWFGDAVLKLRGDGRPLSPLPYVIPFVRTPVNIARYAFERTPFAPLARQWRDDIAAGGARRDIALARMGTGTTIMLMAYDWADSGLITGGNPPDGNPDNREAWRRQGWQPYSVKVGDRWYSFSRTDPFGMTMGMAADIAGAMKRGEIDADAVDEWQELVGMSIAAVSATAINKTYLSGLAEFTEVMSDPSRYSEAYVSDLVASFVPYSSLMRAAEGAADPTLREASDPWEAVQARIAILSENLTPRRDLWGEEIRIESGLGRAYDFFSPVAARPVKDSPIDAELARLGRGIERIGKKTGFDGVAVNFRDWPQAYDDYVRLAGNGLKHPAWGLGARDLLDAVVSGRHELSEVYRVLSDGPDGAKRAFIRNIVSQYRQLARQAVLADPKHAAFAAHIAELQAEKRRRALPVTVGE